MSEMRKRYFAKLTGRSIILILCACLCIAKPEVFDILNGMNFFRQVSPLHILWGIWIIDTLYQIFPIHNRLPLGSQKVFANHFRPAGEHWSQEALRRYRKSSAKGAWKVLLLWCLLLAVIGILYIQGRIGKIALFMISVLFYVCDLICVLIWCPFRLIMGNRCCTTCRIFNWDHFMMFSPMLFMGGFYGMSLVILSILALVVWEIGVLIHPERFWEKSNIALKCSQCTDKLCTQYCRKARR